MMSKKFYIGICCLALLATSVASGYSEDFEGYTGNLGDPWDGTPEFNASGWADLYRGTYNRGSTADWNLGNGYNTTQGIVSVPTSTYGHVGATHLLDAPQDASSTFVYTVMVDGPNEVRVALGSAGLLASTAPTESYIQVSFVGSSAILSHYYDGGYLETSWTAIGLDINALNWVEIKTEVDTNSSARATVLRTYVRDLDDGGAGPSGAWSQVNWGGPGGGQVLATAGPDYQIEAIGIRGKMAGAVFDNIYATPEPVTLAILGAGGLLLLRLRRRR